MTQVGEGQEADEATPRVLTVGAPAVGDVLADRYELAQHINDDSAGRQVWRGIDVILRRPVAVVLRYPGGDSAQEMLQAAVTASRVIHPNLAGVYDAIDEGEKAYVVREWIDGEALRELVAEEPLDAERATTIAHSVASAVAAVHATGMVHGNIHPGTVMVGDDSRVVLSDARATDGDTADTDVRAIGGVLYFALTGHWPHTEVSPSALPDAVRDGSGIIAAPRQVRAGVPAYLDDLTMDLLDARLALPAADVLAAELGRLDVASEEPFLNIEAGALRFSTITDEPPARTPAARRKVALGVGGLLVVAAAGLLLGISVLADDGDTDAGGNPGGVVSTTAPASTAPPLGDPKPVALTAAQVRIVDDKSGGRDELGGAALMVDGDPETAWRSDRYNNLPFGAKEDGMGVLIKFPSPLDVSLVQVQLSGTGASATLFSGEGDPGNTREGDTAIFESYSKTPIGEPIENHEATTLTFIGFQPDQKVQYLLVWFKKLPRSPEGELRLEIQEITVQAR